MSVYLMDVNSRGKRYYFFCIIFIIYIYLMIGVLLHYKNLSPVLLSSLAKDRPYLIDTEGYKLPDFDPYHYSVLRYLYPPPEIDCSRGKRPLTTGISNYQSPNSSSFELHNAIVIEEDFLEDYNVVAFSCCYQIIKRDALGDPHFEEHLVDSRYDYADAKFFMEKVCHPLKKKVTTLNANAAYVQCDSNSRVFYRNIHLFVSLKRFNSSRKTEPMENNQRLNVMILGIDSISRINMQRYMPKTVEYLRDIQAIDLKGFNKNFENTFPNLIAILTGHEATTPEFGDLMQTCDGYFDSLPFLWKVYGAANYTTIYGEDCSDLGTFTIQDNKGFRKSPTDYYFRPYMKAIEDILGSNDGYIWISSCKICGGSKMIFQHILDYAETVSKTFDNVKPYFSFLWTSSLTHDRLQFAGAADEPVVKLLKSMNETGYWNNTIVFLMSDHGVRFGSIRETYLGKKEESLPMNYIIVPQWFKNKFPRAYENLIYNQDRLATTMDLHETLMDIAKQKYEDEDYLKREHNVSENRLSLFRKISSSRTCFSAKIPLNYCAGQVAAEVPETPLVRLAARSILLTLNRGLAKFPMCHQFTDFIVKKSFILQFFEKEVKSNFTFYEVQLISYPGEALLEGIVQLIYTEDTYKSSVIGDVSRINRYANQSYCISDVQKKKYCLCKNS